jgi:hypothetical protein
MAYYLDLSPYSYLDCPSDQKAVLNVGWLDKSHPFPKGSISTEIINRLFILCKSPENKTRGYHECPFCFSFWPKKELGVLVEIGGEAIRLGSAEIRVKCGEKTYAAPNMILHYIKDHKYLPPAEFIECLVQTAQS